MMISFPTSRGKHKLYAGSLPPLSYLTSCTATKSDLHFANSYGAVFNEPDLQTPNFPYSKSHVCFLLPMSLQRICKTKGPVEYFVTWWSFTDRPLSAVRD